MNPGCSSNEGETEKRKNLNSSILGVPGTPLVKLCVMAPEEKKRFMLKFEEWRRKRKEKLAASILTKEKMVEEPILEMTTKSGSQNHDFVFERLRPASPVKEKKRNEESSNFSSVPGISSDMLNTALSEGMCEVDETQAENWLKELHMLIVKMKYSPDRCEEWLAAIREKYPKYSQLPIYWECLTALKESKDDVKPAVDDHETVISKEEQVEPVGNSLENLLDKMVIEQKKPRKSKIDKGIDPKNIFNSTVIKLALQPKNVKKLDPQSAQSQSKQLYVATPVRRSSRIQTLSKGVASKETLAPDVKKNLTFKLN